MASLVQGGSPSCNGSWKAGLEGAAKGFVNIIGLGGLIPQDTQGQDDLSAAQASLSSATTEWNKAIAAEEARITEDQISYLQTLIVFASDQQQAINTMLSEKEQTNSLLIGMLIVLVIFLILYDVL
jgi:hypothetical protein